MLTPACQNALHLLLVHTCLLQQDYFCIISGSYICRVVVLNSKFIHYCQLYHLHMYVGLKPGQRKVLFTCFKRNDKREIKVVQLAGSVAEHSAYHHGEVDILLGWFFKTIMYQCFPQEKRGQYLLQPLHNN